jgi:integrase
MGSDRDRALLAFYVSTGARASELLGVTVDRVDVGRQLIGVLRRAPVVCSGCPLRPTPSCGGASMNSRHVGLPANGHCG